MSFAAGTYAVVEKDIHSELRTRYALNALLMFVITAVATILFALRTDNPSIELLSGMYWVVIFFTAMSGLSRIFVSEEERGTVMVLQLSATPPVIYFGKLLFNSLLTLLLTMAVTVLYVIVFPGFLIKSYDVFFFIVLLGSLGFASSATIIAAIIAKAGARGTLYPVLSFPILIPLLMTVMNGTTRALAGETMASAMGEFQVLAGYLLVMVGGSVILFDYVWKD
ncbi:MAG TPA: heme exporter protein CcmB [Bacteroidota bacterium]|nr:heme exporter protein CcmB [Bacteroidota bacterium]